jgi:hypothetical protein
MLGSRIDPLLAADHVRDTHQVVIDDVGQVIGRHAVGLEQDLRIDHVPVQVDVPAQQVIDTAAAGRLRHQHANHVGLAGGLTPGHLVFRQMQIRGLQGSAVAGLAARGAQGLELLGTSIADESLAGIHQLAGVLAIQFHALTLAIGTVVSAHVGALVPVQAQPAQGIEDRLLRLGGGTRAVRVLDAQEELAAVRTGKAIIEQRHVSGADMGITGGRWGDTGTNGHGLSVRLETRGIIVAGAANLMVGQITVLGEARFLHCPFLQR